MATLITLSIKQPDGKYKNYTINIYDQVDQYGNNVAMYEEQTKEERESKAKKTYLGNGRVIWTNGQVEVAPKKEKTTAFITPKEDVKPQTTNSLNENLPFSNIQYAEPKNKTSYFEDVDDLPF